VCDESAEVTQDHDHQYQTMSLIHPLLEAMTVAEVLDPSVIKQVKVAIKQNISKRYAEPEIQDIRLLCTTLDP